MLRSIPSYPHRPASSRRMFSKTSTRLFWVCAASLLLTGCAAPLQLSVKAPPLEFPPLPPELLLPCEEPTPLQRGTQADVAQKLIDVTGPWGRCIRKDDRLVERIKYRMEIEEKWKADLAKANARPWWKFWD